MCAEKFETFPWKISLAFLPVFPTMY